MNNFFNKIKLHKTEKNYILEIGENNFLINHLLYQIFELKKNNTKDLEIIKNIKSKFDINVEKVELNEIIDKKILEISEEIEKSEDTFNLHSSIYFKVNLLSRGERLNKICGTFTFLFKKNISILMSIIGLFFIVYTIYQFRGFILDLTEGKKLILLILTYISLFLIGLFHELGHASASYALGIPPKKIGFGLYLIFPVLFADVSDIWRLNKKERIMVNVGGIYFQIIITALICVFFYFNLPPIITVFLKSLVLSSFIMLLFSFNPFLRNDGYWIYSDYFEIPNLSKESKNFPKKLYQGFKENGIGSIFRSINKNRSLFTYSFSNTLVIGFIYFGWIMLFVKNYMFISSLINNVEIENMRGEIIYLVLNITLITRIIMSKLKSTKQSNP